MPESQDRMTARKVHADDLLQGKFYKQEGFDPNYVITPRGMRVSRTRVLGTVVDTYRNDDGSYGAFVIDDGTATIRCKLFQDLSMMDDVEEGDIVDVVGKVKEYEGERYITPELVVARSPTYELVRALELRQAVDRWQDYQERIQEMQEQGRDADDIVEEMKGDGLREQDTRALLEFLSAEEQFESGGQAGAPVQQTADPQQQAPQMQSADTGSEDDPAREDMKKDVLNAIQEHDDGDGADYSVVVDTIDASEDVLEDVINDLLSDGTCYEPRPGRIKQL